MNWFRYDRSLRHERVNSAVCKAIFKLVYRFEIANSDHQTLKSVKNNSSKKRQITVHSLVPQCALSVFSFSECKITKNFPGLCPYPTGWEGLPALPRLPGCTTFFLLAALVEKPAPQKNCWTQSLVNDSILLIAPI